MADVPQRPRVRLRTKLFLGVALLIGVAYLVYLLGRIIDHPRRVEDW